METKSVIISNITLTRPTQKTLKLKEDDFDKVLKMKLTDAQKGDLTFKVEFKQEREVAATSGAKTDRRRSAFGVAESLEGHSKVNSGPRYKLAWVNAMNLNVIQKKGFVIGANVNEITGQLYYLLTEEYTTATMRDGKIVSSPKRKGKGGNILTANGKLIFQETAIVTPETSPEFDGFTYADFVKFERSQAIQYDAEIKAEDVPEETRTDGFFDDEFYEWLVGVYTDGNVGILKEVA